MQLAAAGRGADAQLQLVVADAAERRRVDADVRVEPRRGERAAEVCATREAAAHVLRHEPAERLHVEAARREGQVGRTFLTDHARDAERAARRRDGEVLDGHASGAPHDHRRARRRPVVAAIVDAKLRDRQALLGRIERDGRRQLMLGIGLAAVQVDVRPAAGRVAGEADAQVDGGERPRADADVAAVRVQLGACFGRAEPLARDLRVEPGGPPARPAEVPSRDGGLRGEGARGAARVERHGAGAADRGLPREPGERVCVGDAQLALRAAGAERSIGRARGLAAHVRRRGIGDQARPFDHESVGIGTEGDVSGTDGDVAEAARRERQHGGPACRRDGESLAVHGERAVQPTGELAPPGERRGVEIGRRERDVDALAFRQHGARRARPTVARRGVGLEGHRLGVAAAARGEPRQARRGDPWLAEVDGDRGGPRHCRRRAQVHVAGQVGVRQPRAGDATRVDVVEDELQVAARHVGADVDRPVDAHRSDLVDIGIRAGARAELAVDRDRPRRSDRAQVAHEVARRRLLPEQRLQLGGGETTDGEARIDVAGSGGTDRRGAVGHRADGAHVDVVRAEATVRRRGDSAGSLEHAQSAAELRDRQRVDRDPRGVGPDVRAADQRRVA